MAKNREQLQQILDELRASLPRWRAEYVQEAAAEGESLADESTSEEIAQHLVAAFAGVADEAWENVSADDEAWLGEQMDQLQREFGIGH